MQLLRSRRCVRPGDGAPEDIVVPAILQVMLMRGEFKQLLAEFGEPPQPAAVKSAADIFRARAFALQTLGEPQKAKAAMDRALSLRRDGTQVLAAAQLARQQNDLPAANTFADEALKLDPNSLEVALVKIQILRQMKESEKALAMADDVIKRFPQNASAENRQSGDHDRFEAGRQGDTGSRRNSCAIAEDGGRQLL